MDKKYDHLSSQKDALELWGKEDIYKYSPDERETFSIDTPPPTVSGALHIGHIFSYTHTDIIARYKRMRGFNVFYPMGFDDNGLPTERFVEKQHKTKAHLMKRSEFIELCLKESEKVEKDFENLWKTMGLSVDWSKTYSTISKKARRISQLSFIDLYEKGLITRKEEPSLYCTTCRTSVAQAELDSEEKASTFNDIQFTTEDGEKLTIATTRPELLPACVAVFYHPSDDRYKHLKGKYAVTPVFDKKVPILEDELVEKSKGTGLVMCCTFGDQTDILWQKKHNLPFVQVVGFDGLWTHSAGLLEGLRVHEARKKILELLGDKLLEKKSIKHPVNVHERCKQEIEYLTLQQWFVKIIDNKDKYLENAEKINWKPAFMKARYKDWVTNLSWDWCISRQRFFGIPFPAWHCEECNKVILADKNSLPVDPQEQGLDSCKYCGSKSIRPDTDVMETWATSASTPQINIGWPDENIVKMPMSMRPQAHDIIRTWAFYTIIKAYHHNNSIPWKDIVISGHVLAGKEKISKSKGENKLAPESLLEQYPADVIRYWTAQGRLGTDTAFSENQLKIGGRLVTKLWNAMRFCKEHIQKKPESKPKLDDLSKWLLHEFSDTSQKYQKLFDEYEYTHALEHAERFFWHNFCDNYLELIKDQIFNPSKYSKEVLEATQHTLYEVGFGILQLFAPVLPYITESLYQSLFSKEKLSSIHLTQLDESRYKHSYPESTSVINKVVDIVGQVRKLKTTKQLSLKVDLEVLTIHSPDKDTLNALKAQENVISGVTRAKAISYINDAIDEPSISQEGEIWKADAQL